MVTILVVTNLIKKYSISHMTNFVTAWREFSESQTVLGYLGMGLEKFKGGMQSHIILLAASCIP